MAFHDHDPDDDLEPDVNGYLDPAYFEPLDPDLESPEESPEPDEDGDLRLTHHLYQFSIDLLPACGAMVGPDVDHGRWNSGDDRDRFMTHLDHGDRCCLLCVRIARAEIAQIAEQAS